MSAPKLSGTSVTHPHQPWLARRNLRLFALTGMLALLLTLASVLLQSAPGPAYGAGEPGKPEISNWDRLHEGLRVHWYAPANTGVSPITGYEVQYKETGASAWTDGPWIGAARKATLTGLKANTEYQARVRAVNANGAGPWTDGDGDKRRTLGVNAQADPPDVTVIPRNGSLMVSWDPPAYFGAGRASIVHYNVQYTPYDGSSYTYQDWTVGGSAAIAGDAVTITGLQNGHDHLVRVRAYNGRVNGNWSVDYHGIPGPHVPRLEIEELVAGLDIPWDLAFTPDGTMLFTERRGLLSARLTDDTVRPITADLSDVAAVGEGGLMSIVVDPGFGSNRRFYTCQRRLKSYSRVVDVAAWTINEDYTMATRVANPLVGDMPGRYAQHNGCRLRFGPDGYLWIGTGDGAVGTSPQNLSSLGGKVLRVNASDGSGAPGNPFSDSPLIYTYGHRNVQGLAARPGTRQMWSVEHGPAVDDEINLLTSGGNYGWDPVPGDNLDAPSYNQDVPMTDLSKYPQAVAARWSSGSSTLATSGGVFLEGERWGDWEERLAVATLKNQELHLFAFDQDGVLQSSISVPELKKTYGRLRSPVMGPDGALYITTSNGKWRRGDDKILKVTAVSHPTAPAAPIVAQGVTSGKLAVNWASPTDDGGDGVNGYRLRYSRDGINWIAVPNPLADLTKTITGLPDGAEYQVQVRAVNDVGAGPWSQSGTGTTNRPPTVASGIDELTIVHESGTKEVSLSGVFADADNDSLTVTADSSAETTATVSVAGDYSKLTVTAQARGAATITVTADDGKGGTASDTFTVKVKAAPMVTSAITDISSLVTEATQDISLSGVFSDADNDALTITADSSDETKATVSVAADYSKLKVAGVAEGTATITVTAEDADGNRVIDTFDVTVVKSADANLTTLSLSAGSIAPSFSTTTYAYTLTVGNDVTSTTVTATANHGAATLEGGLSGSLSAITGGTASAAISLTVGANAVQVEVTAEDGTTKQTYDVTVTRGAPPNRAPTVADGIEDVTIVHESGTKEVSLSGVFADADNDSLTVTADSSAETTATVSVAGDYSKLTVTAQARGAATITVTADDGNGGTVSDTFTVQVKAAPVVASALDYVNGLVAGTTQEVSLSGVFSDGDGDALTITAESPDETVATVSVALDYSGLTVGAVAEGMIMIQVTAQDADGNQVSEFLGVIVVEIPGPVIGLTLEDTPDGLKVSWQPPETGGAPKSYIVHARLAKGGSGSGMTKTPRAEKLSVTFSNVESGATYNVWVRGENAAGKGERVKAAITLGTAPTEVPGPVVNLRLTATADSITATWDAPATGDAPTRYIAHVRPEGGATGSGETRYPKSKDPEATFRDLEAGKTYKVWVRGENTAGKGERVHATVTTLTE